MPPEPKKRKLESAVEKTGHGNDYHTQLLMYFAHRGYMLCKKQNIPKNYEFELGKEIKHGGKFDDILYRYRNKETEIWNYVYIQAKHRITGNKITLGELLSKNNNNPFALLKYFSSHIDIKKKYRPDIQKFKNCVIATNTDFDYEKNNSYDVKIKDCLDSVNVDPILQIDHTEGTKYYKLRKDVMIDILKVEFKIRFENIDTKKKKGTDFEIYNNLKDIIDDEDIIKSELETFLDSLLFIVNLPNRQNLHEIIKSEMGKEFSCLDNLIIGAYNRKMYNYLISAGGAKYLGGSEVQAFFACIKQTIKSLRIVTNYCLKVENLKIIFETAVIDEATEKIKNYLSNSAKQILLLEVDSTLLTALKIDKAMEQLSKENVLTEFSRKEKYRIFSLNDLIEVESLTDEIIDSFETDILNFLVIICGNQNNVTEDLLKFSNVSKDRQRNKKIIFIYSEVFKPTVLSFIDRVTEDVIDQDADRFKVNDLQASSRLALMEREVKFQGKTLPFFQLLSSLDDLLHFSSEAVECLISGSCIIEEPLKLSDLEGAYIKFQEKIDKKFLVEFILEQQNPVVKCSQGINEIFVISGLLSKDQFIEELHVKDSSKIEQLTKFISIDECKSISLKLDSQFNETDFKIMCRSVPDNKIYWISFKNNNFVFEYLYKPDFYLKRKFCCPSDEQLLEEDKFFEEFKDNKVVLITDIVGMGKSTGMISISEKMLESYWVIHMYLKNCDEAIRNLPDNITVDDVLHFLSQTLNLKTPLEKDLAKYKLMHDDSTRPLRILFDGFDEIVFSSNEDYQSVNLNDNLSQSSEGDNQLNLNKRKFIKLLQFLKDKTKSGFWVTARSHDSEVLENNLTTAHIKFETIEPIMQKEYFQRIWRTSFRLNFNNSELNEIFKYDSHFERYYNKLCARMVKIFETSFIGIPLTLHLFAESFRDKFKTFISNSDRYKIEEDFNNLSKLSLYEYFIDKKFQIYFNEKSGLSNGFTKISQKWFRQSLIKKHQILAFYEIFGDESIKTHIGIKLPFKKSGYSLIIDNEELQELYRCGLIQSLKNGKFEFIHRSFAEYFVSLKFVDTLSTKEMTNPEKYKQMYEFMTSIIFGIEYKVIYEFLDGIAQKYKTEDWIIKWIIITGNGVENLFTETRNIYNVYFHNYKLVKKSAIDYGENTELQYKDVENKFKGECTDLLKLESTGIKYVISNMVLNVEMTKRFIGILETDRVTGYHKIYAHNIWHKLILPLLELLERDKFSKKLNINKLCILNLFQRFARFYSKHIVNNDHKVFLFHNLALEGLLKTIENTIQSKNCSPEYLAYSIDSLRTLKDMNFKLVFESGNYYLLSDNAEKQIIYSRKVLLKYPLEHIRRLLKYRAKNSTDDVDFLIECRNVIEEVRYIR